MLFIVADADDADTVTVDILEWTANGGGVLAVEDRLLDAASDTGDFHEEVVFKCRVVGVEADVDVHYRYYNTGPNLRSQQVF